MTELSFFQLLIVTGSILVISITFLLIGYWMGRNSAERPFSAVKEEKEFDPGSTDEPEGDYFKDEIPDYGETQERVATIT